MVRDINKVVVLGAGTSINALTPAEKAYINRCKVVIAVNKFMAFYRQTSLMPTHVYFVDINANNLRMLQYVFDVCCEDKLTGLEFILNDRLYGHLSCTNLTRSSVRKIGAQLYWHVRRFMLAPSYRHAKDVGSYIKCKMLPTLPDLYCPPGCSYTLIRHTLWLEGGNWAKDLIHSLFHFRGSLTTVLNYISIKYPNRDVLLVGNDFDGNEYFFQKELDALEFDWTDFTTAVIKESGKHFSATEHKGTTMFDKFGDVMNYMTETGNSVYVCNKESLLHTEADVPYRSILP
jgi:hypothetical protein